MDDRTFSNLSTVVQAAVDDRRRSRAAMALVGEAPGELRICPGFARCIRPQVQPVTECPYCMTVPPGVGTTTTVAEFMHRFRLSN